MTSLGTEKLTLAELQRSAVNILRVLLDLPAMERSIEALSRDTL